MPRSGSRSKKGRAKARQAATTSDAPTASATTNSFAALAPPAAAGDGEKADEEEEEEEEEETAGAAAGTTERTAAAAAGIPPTTNSPTPGGAAGEESSLAEDLLPAPSHLAANDPVRIKMAAYLEQCMLTGATPWPWVMEIVLPPTNGTPLGGPTSRQIGELITSMANIEKAIVSKLTAVGGRGKSVSFDASAYGSTDKRGRSPASDAGSPLPEKAWESGPGRGGHYNPFGLNVNRRNTVRRVRDFLQVTSARPPVFHCYGLHEWAMLYRPAGAEGDSRRLHQTLPLRVSQEEINAMVEGKGGNMGCTHFDAFRFFTPEAKPLNNVVLERSSQKSNEQPGCVHANMDLFKWALRLWPLLPSEKMADALELAVSCRMLDMRASPYDLAAHGKLSPEGAAGKSGGKAGGLPPESWDPSPVRIETEQGRKEYQQAQWDLYHRSVPIRRSLLRHMDKLLEVWGV